jgi:hypothetical protein
MNEKCIHDLIRMPGPDKVNGSPVPKLKCKICNEIMHSPPSYTEKCNKHKGMLIEWNELWHKQCPMCKILTE